MSKRKGNFGTFVLFAVMSHTHSREGGGCKRGNVPPPNAESKIISFERFVQKLSFLIFILILSPPPLPLKTLGLDPPLHSKVIEIRLDSLTSLFYSRKVNNQFTKIHLKFYISLPSQTWEIQMYFPGSIMT